MEPVYQTRMGMPTGNCFAACIASIFEIDVREAPDCMLHGDNWYKPFNEWLQERGMCYIEFPAGGELDEVIGYCILTGPGPRGCNHAVVGKAGKVVHDPHPFVPDFQESLLEIKFIGMFFPLDPKAIWSIAA